MANISPQHIQPLTAGFVGLLVGSLVVIALLNYAANH
jgi:hypothetical protein